MWMMLIKGILAGAFYSFSSLSTSVIIAKITKEHDDSSFALSALFANSLVQMIFGAIAVFVLHLALHFLRIDYRNFALIGAIILFLLAVSFYRKKPIFIPPKTLPRDIKTTFTYLFAYSLSFPIRIIGFFAFFGAMGLHKKGSFLLYDILPILGVLIGSLIFWIFFTISVRKSYHFQYEKLTESFARISAITFVIFSLIGLAQVYFISH